MITNNKIFARIWRKIQPYGLTFISSNGGTGKTVFFRMRLLRDAVERGIPFHIFVRFRNQMEQAAAAFLDVKPTYSARQRRLLARCSVRKDDEHFIYIVDTKTGKELAQVVNVHGQAFYKQFGNTIGARRAFFDEILAEDGHYAPNEVNKFNRLVFTMARGDDYHVIALYNNTSPNFDYFNYFGGKTYNTHVADSGALFVFFRAPQYSTRADMADAKSIQSIIRHTAYNDVYCNNTFAEYPNFCRPRVLRGEKVLCVLEVENCRLKLRKTKDGYLYLDEHNAAKKNGKRRLYSVNEHERTQLKQLPDGLRAMIAQYRDAARLKVSNIKYSIFAKILCEKI